MKEYEKIEREFIYEISALNDYGESVHPGTNIEGDNAGYYRASRTGRSDGDANYTRKQLVELVESGAMNDIGAIRMTVPGHQGGMNHFKPTHYKGEPLKLMRIRKAASSGLDSTSSELHTKSSKDDDFMPEFLDETTFTAIKTRRGQHKFRQQLLIIHQETCLISGTNAVGALEAAHIFSHSDETNYSLHNGLLLRADLHTLFDLNQIRIDENSQITVSECLRGTDYEQYDGKILFTEVSPEMKANIVERNKKCR
ncbi:hypothetical protein BCT86_13040 [Vibrio breoganii]|uniref:HNH endonuclease n=1 Tax=Vibrio breoganii TaxID=553239 RepID=UPI000C86687D|nr:HNH endonuclease [Vibrio breoganii]PML05255.1 hypothetical protein BCT86_13040 [Vibrio breoganii]